MYVSFFVKQNSKVSIDIETLKHKSEFIINILSLAPMLLITTNGIEHLLKVFSLISGLISLKQLVNGENSKTKYYLHAIFLSSMLVSIYNNDILKTFLPFIYLYYVIHSLLLLNNNIINLNDFMTEALAIHLLFFFTKK